MMFKKNMALSEKIMKRIWLILLVITSIASLYTHFITVGGWMADDAFISFRYAENLINGHGLVFNIGEHVEGYSNFLWVMFIAAGLWIGILPESSALILNLVAAIGTLFIITFFIRSTRQDKKDLGSLLFPAMLFSGVGSFWIWTFGGGLETIFYTFIGTIIIGWPLLNGHSNSKLLIMGILCSIQVLNRPDGIIFFIYVLSYYGIMFYKKKTFRELLWIIIPFSTIVFIFFLWKINYYGGIIPNTIYAKVDPSSGQALRGFKYLCKFFLLYPLITLFCIVHLVTNGTSHRETLPISGFLAVYFMFVILIGGDFMIGYRIMIPVIPLLIYSAYKGIVSIFPEKVTFLAIMLTIISSTAQTRFNPDMKWRIETDTIVSSGKVMGAWLAKSFPPNTTIALNAAGAIPYYSRLKTIDMLGLTNKEIARDGKTNQEPSIVGHLKSNPKVVLRLKPELVLLGVGLGNREPHIRNEIDLVEVPEFSQLYKLRTFPLDKDSVRIYVRKDFIIPLQLQ
jgi:arabinofuranosyltransferase